MAQKFLTNLDLNKNQLQNAVLQNLATAPSSPAEGQVYYDTTDNALKVYDGTSWVNLHEGDISAVVAGTGLTGGGTSGSVTLNLSNTGVSAGSYGSGTAIPTITVDAQGRITAVSTTSISSTLDIAADSGTDNGVLIGTDTLTISGGTGLSSAVSGDTITVNLDNTTVSAGSYGSASAVSTFTVDAQGRLTAAGTANIAITSSAVTNFTEAVQDVAGAQIATNGSHTGISASYDDAGDGAIDLSLTTTGVTGATYGDANSVAQFTVDTYGRITSASNVDISITSSQVSDLSSNAVTSISGTANEVEVSASTGTVTVGLPDSVTITSNLTVGGNLTVNGDTVTVNTASLSVEDPLIILANGNSSTDSVDIGFYGLYDTSGSQDLYAGLFRDATDGKFRLFKDLQTAPTTTVNTGGTGYSVATLVANLEGNVTGNASTATALQNARTINGVSFDGTANITVTAAAGTLTGTTLNSSVVTSSLTTVGTIGTGTWNGSTIAVAYGGTGATTAAGAKTNLGFMTRYAATVGDGASTAIDVTHSLGTEDVLVEVYDAASKETVICDVDRTSTSVVTLRFASAPALNSLRVVVIG